MLHAQLHIAAFVSDSAMQFLTGAVLCEFEERSLAALLYVC